MKKFTLAIAAVAIAAIALFFVVRRELPAKPPVVTQVEVVAGAKEQSAIGATPPPAASSTRPPQLNRERTLLRSNARWVDYEDRFVKGDYSWLVAHARQAPQLGSYYYALRALVACQTLLDRGPEEAQTRVLQGTEGDRSTLAVRLATLKILFSRCSNVGSRREVADEVIRLEQESQRAGDAVVVAQQEVRGLSDKTIPLERRQQKLIDLMALNDAEIMLSLKNVLVDRGARLENEPITSIADIEAYRVAWDLAICANYGACRGSNSLEAQENCLYRSDCDYLDTWQFIERRLPPVMFERVSQFYSRIDSNLSQRNFGAFGVK